MSVISEIRASLDAIGIEQQVCVFLFLMSYPLTLGALLEARGRRYAAGTAAAAALGFIVTTSPWMHAVLLLVLAVGGVGVFIAMVYAADLIYRRMSRPVPVIEVPPEPEIAPSVVAPAGRERLPIAQTATVKT